MVLNNIEKVLIIDFGSQFNQLIAQCIRKIGIYSIVKSSDVSPSFIQENNIKAIILSGGPNSVHDSDAPFLDPEIFNLGLPILGICYGMQYISKIYNGTIERSSSREYGVTKVDIQKSLLFDGLKDSITALMSHGDSVVTAPKGFIKIASTPNCIAGIENPSQNLYGVQFHLEVTDTPDGITILKNFLFKISHMNVNWSMKNFIDSTIKDLRETINNKKVILALSGGVDSSVAAVLLHKAIGDQLTCIFVDTGLLRLDEAQKVKKNYEENFHLHIKFIDAKKQFLDALKDIEDPETKRKIIGENFIKVFSDAAKSLKDITFLAQGTIYPDVIESSTTSKNSQVIKSHHNVGGLPKDLHFTLVEPLRNLFKDEVRELGSLLNMQHQDIYRHPFPGPGLGIRIIGAITPEKIEILQKADNIFIDELYENDLYYKIGQAFAVLLPVKSVGVMGDERTYEYTLALRSVTSTNFMTARWYYFSQSFLEKISSRIVNEVKGINRVVYDITSKPPATIEWE